MSQDQNEEPVSELGRALIVAEFGSLNDDIRRRLDERSLAIGTFSVAASLIGISIVPGIILVLFPWAVLLVSLWILHNEISVRRKTCYLRLQERRYFPDGGGFLTWKDQNKDPLLSTKGIDIESVQNWLLVGCSAACDAVGALRIWASSPTGLDLITSGVFLAASVVAIALTWRNNMVRREKRLLKRAAASNPPVPLVAEQQLAQS